MSLVPNHKIFDLSMSTDCVFKLVMYCKLKLLKL